MTDLWPTWREPLFDLEAQFAALRAVGHPKKAVWISAGTPFPDYLRGSETVLELPAGTLVSSVTRCWMLERNPTIEALAKILGYTEPRPTIGIIVQARNAAGAVVWEQLASWGKCGSARHRARDYGSLVVTMTMEECLDRRQKLIAAEEGVFL